MTAGPTPGILFAATDEAWARYEEPLRAALGEAGVAARIGRDLDAAEVDYVVYAPAAGPRDFHVFPGLKAVLCLWAGVEDVVSNPTLTVPLTRMVDPDLSAGMAEYVTAHTLRHHLGLDRHLLRTEPEWSPSVPPLARDRHVGILGLGAIGRTVAETLLHLGFAVSGWSRRPKALDGVMCESGPEGFAAILARSEILVLLLPLTPETDTILDRAAMARLPRGAVILNPGRGALIEDRALLDALDDGRLSDATLDTFRDEPLPADHPFWAHPRVTVTPHIAAATRPASAARVIAENVRRGETGEPLLHVVDRDAGY